jgi:uncharacterized protein (TIGR02246 family)
LVSTEAIMAIKMTRRELGVIAAAATIGMSKAATAIAAVGDEVGAKVRIVLDGYEAAWNKSDMTAMWALATDDVHWVNVVGMHWRGKAEVQKAHQVYFDLMFKDRWAKVDEIESIEPLPGGALVVVSRWSFGGFRQPDGVMRPPGKDRMSLVLVPRDSGLAIAHGANIMIDPVAAQYDPIKH